MTTDQDGNMWFGTWGGGACKFDGSTWNTYNSANSGLAHNWVNAISIDRAGNKWFGTDGGVSKLDREGWTTYTTADGLADNRVYSIAIDARNNKWFATWGGGVSVLQDLDWHTTYLPLIVKTLFHARR